MNDQSVNFRGGLLTLTFEGLSQQQFSLAKSYHSTDDYFIDFSWKEHSGYVRLQVEVHPKRQNLVVSTCALSWANCVSPTSDLLTNSFLRQEEASWIKLNKLSTPAFLESCQLNRLGYKEVLQPAAISLFAHGQTAFSIDSSSAYWVVSLDDKMALTVFGTDHSTCELRASKQMNGYALSHSALVFDLLLIKIPRANAPDKIIEEALGFDRKYSSTKREKRNFSLNRLVLPIRIIEQQEKFDSLIQSTLFEHLKVKELILELGSTAEEFTTWFSNKNSLSAFAKTCDRIGISAGISLYPCSLRSAEKSGSDLAKSYWHLGKTEYIKGISFDSEKQLQLVQQQLVVLRELGFSKFLLLGLEGIGMQRDSPIQTSGQRFEVLAKILRDQKAVGSSFCVSGLPISFTREIGCNLLRDASNQRSWPWFVSKALARKLACNYKFQFGRIEFIHKKDRFISPAYFSRNSYLNFSSTCSERPDDQLFCRVERIPGSAKEWIAFESEIGRLIDS